MAHHQGRARCRLRRRGRLRRRRRGQPVRRRGRRGGAAAGHDARGDLPEPRRTRGRGAPASGADALHPGYGFLSESPALAEACAQAGIVWVGPPPEAMRVMAHKARAKEVVADAGVPVLPSAVVVDGGPPDSLRSRASASAIRSWSRPPPGEGAGGCAWCTSRASWPPRWPRLSGRPLRPSAPTTSSWSATSRHRATSRSRWSGTPTALSCTCRTGSARCSAGTRRWSRRRPQSSHPSRPAARCGTPRWRPREPSATRASARWSTWSTRAASTSSR